ncbi:MAG: transketolase [Deltaproteobacteria bacterium]|nr:transketolase [Deltaproteobacteria bacterium]
MREISYSDALKEAIAEEMRADESVFFIGQSIEGGNFPYTEGLVHEFGQDRIMDTPICETGMSGAGVGAALAGYRPIVELMFADFMYVAGDEALLKPSQWRFLHGGNVTLPLVFIGAVGGGLRLANEHSQIPSAIVLHFPGLKLAVPSNPYDAKGLLKTAIRDNNPVWFFWHKGLMMAKGHVPEEEYTLPFGKADIKKEGIDVTVLAISNMVNHAMEVAQALEGTTSVEVIDPRTLEPFDLDTVLESVEKTTRLVIVDEDTERCGFAGEIAAQIIDSGFDFLDAPIKRVCAANYPIPGGYLEEHILPGPQDIRKAIEDVMA